MLEKHKGNMFETFEASPMVLSTQLVKLCFKKSPLAGTFFKQFCQKSIGFLTYQ